MTALEQKEFVAYSASMRWQNRFRKWLGFGRTAWPHMDDLDSDPRFCESFFVTESVIYFGYVDRVRILLTGRVHHVTLTKTDKPIEHSASRSSVSVMGWGQ